MANASNNGLLPIVTQGQNSGGQNGYSQVSPMFGAYYNVAQAPQGSSVLGYNMSAGTAMPYGGTTQPGSGAIPTPPSGGSLAAGGSNSNPAGSAGTATGASYSNPGTGGSVTGAQAVRYPGAIPPPGAANVHSQQNYSAAPAPAHYNPTGALASPNQRAIIPAQVQGNSSGQYQGSAQPVQNATAYRDTALAMGPQGIPGSGNPIPGPIPPGNPGMGGGKPPTQGPPVGIPNPGGSGTNHPVGNPPWQNPGSTNHPTNPGKGGKPPVKPPQSALDKWLAGDTTYQQQLAEFNAEQQAYNQNYNNSLNQINQNFNATQRGMNNQAALDRMNQQYDFAGRGVLSSGAYAQALDQYNTQFQNNLGNLVTGENQQKTANQTNLNNFLRQLVLQRNAAKADAISRRAAQLGITS